MADPVPPNRDRVRRRRRRRRARTVSRRRPASPRPGWRVLVLERAEQLGGGSRTAPFDEAGAVYDVCSTAHPFGVGVAGVRRPPPRPPRPGLVPSRPSRWPTRSTTAAPPCSIATSTTTAAGLGLDGPAYRSLVEPLLARWDDVADGVPRPARARCRRIPSPWPGSGSSGSLQPPCSYAASTSPPRAGLVAGLAAHSFLPLDHLLTGGIACRWASPPTLSAGRWRRAARRRSSTRWPPSSRAAAARSSRGTRSRPSASSRRRAPSLLDVTPRQLLALAGDRLRGWKGWRLRQWRYGPAACKADYLLSGPVPWTSEACRQAGVVHLGGRFEDIAHAEQITERRVGGRAPVRAGVAAGARRPRPGAGGDGTCCGPTPTCPTARPSTSHARIEGAARPVRPRLARPRRREAGGTAIAVRGLRPELRRRRHRRRFPGRAPARAAPVGGCRPLPDAAARRVAVLGVDATGRRRLTACAAGTPPGESSARPSSAVHELCDLLGRQLPAGAALHRAVRADDHEVRERGEPVGVGGVVVVAVGHDRRRATSPAGARPRPAQLAGDWL